MSDTIPPAREEELERTLNDLLAGSSGTGMELPPLAQTEESPEWLKALAQSIEELLEQIVKPFVPDFDLPSGADLELWIQIVLGIIAVLALVGLVRLLLQVRRERRKYSVIEGVRPPGSVEDEEEVVSRLLEKGRFREAMRMRWRLFCARQGFDRGLTPLESAGRGGLAESLLYTQVMFQAQEPSSERYHRFDEELGSIEGRTV